MVKTLKHKLSFALLISILSTVAAIILLYTFIQKKERYYSQFRYAIEKTNTLILKDVTVLRDFFENETINASFFKTKKSRVLYVHNNLSDQIQKAIQNIDSLQSKNAINLSIEIEELRNTYSKYNQLIDEIVKEILIRGFKDAGIEGEMRYYAHKLEDYQNELNLINILQLRRHEKDFIIRQESEYISKYRTLKDELVKNISENSTIAEKIKSDIITLLNNYERLFINLTEYERRIGIKNSIGLKAQIDRQVTTLEGHLQSAILKSTLLEKNALIRLKNTFVLFLCIILVIGIFAAVFFSNRITRPIIELSEKISEFVAGDFRRRNILTVKNAKYEIDSLANNFSLMEQHIISQMNALRNTNEELATLIGKASKDIKAPLLEIKLLYDDAIKQNPSEGFIGSKEKIDYSWYKMLTIVDELSTVRHIKTEKIKVEKINLESLAKVTFLEHKGLPQFSSVIFSISYSLKQDFYSSKELFRLIFFHLFENSIKYSIVRKGFSFLRVKIENQDKFMVKITVSDNGIGINKEEQAHIFKMFYRTQNKLDGTGLGLYIVQNSLQKINGVISLESDENTGTTFTIVVPNKSPYTVFNNVSNVKEEIELVQLS